MVVVVGITADIMEEEGPVEVEVRVNNADEKICNERDFVN